MAYACDICGKGKQFGSNVSFSQRHTQKVWKPNLQRKYVSLDGSRIQLKVCTQCIRTLNKYQQAAKDKEAALAATAEAAKPTKATKKPATKA